MQTAEQIIIQQIESSLPIIVFPERALLPSLKKTFSDDSITLKTEFEIYKALDMKNEGGVVCEIKFKGVAEKDMKAIFLCSLTHLNVKKGEPFFNELMKYKMKRIRKLSQLNRR